MRWDRRTKKFIKGDGVGADNKKLVRSESGQKLPASFKSGVFDEWRSKQRISIPKVGEAELKKGTIAGFQAGGGAGAKHYRHKAAVPKSDDQRKKDKDLGRTVGKPGKPGTTAGGLKSADQIRRDRTQKAQNKHRSSGPGKGPDKSKGNKSSGGGSKPRRK